MYLIGLRTPSNINSDLVVLQSSVFRLTGFASAFAIPPMVPLGWFENEPETGTGPDFQNTSLHLGSWKFSSEMLWIEVQPESTIQKLRAKLPPVNDTGYINTLNGIFICQNERTLTSEEVDRINALVKPSSQWKSSRICCYNLRSVEESANWWEEVYIEEQWSHWIKKRG